MATLEEYKTVHPGKEPPNRLAVTAELGDGGCNVIAKDNGSVVGRWSSWEQASVALNRLQNLGSGFEYRLEESHHWVTGAQRTTTCSVCDATLQIPELSGIGMGTGWD